MQKQDILKHLNGRIADASGRVCIMAGHFALFPTNGHGPVIPGIFQDIKDEEIAHKVQFHPYMGLLPVETLALALSVAKENTDFAFLVNDWQHIPKHMSTDTENFFRKGFYQNTTTLPDSFEKMFLESGITKRVVNPGTFSMYGNTLFFSETRLRNYFDNHVEFKSCPLKNGCAQEYVPFVQRIAELGYTELINFIPDTCETPIRASTEYSIENGCYINVTNIFCNGHRHKTLFWDDVRMQFCESENTLPDLTNYDKSSNVSFLVGDDID